MRMSTPCPYAVQPPQLFAMQQFDRSQPLIIKQNYVKIYCLQLWLKTGVSV